MEIRASAVLDFMILEPVTETVITGVKEEPLDLKALQALPGIAGYIVQEGDSLWDIAKNSIPLWEISLPPMNFRESRSRRARDCFW